MAFFEAVQANDIKTMQRMLADGSAHITDLPCLEQTVWRLCSQRSWHYEAAVLSSLLKVITVLGDVPSDSWFKDKFRASDIRIITEGQKLRARLPSFLEQQRARLVAHCPLPAVLQKLVVDYALPTCDDIWEGKLRVRAPRAKRPRTAADSWEGKLRVRAPRAKRPRAAADAAPLRRSRRFRLPYEYQGRLVF
jgi:hypothetical protein